jgi:hypothetical protein
MTRSIETVDLGPLVALTTYSPGTAVAPTVNTPVDALI